MPRDVDMEGGGKSDWVRITSVDGFSFMVLRKVAMGSGTLKNMLSSDSNFAEALSGTCPLQERAVVLEKVLEYLAYKNTYEENGSKDDLEHFEKRVPPEIALELLMAADYLES
ncbi:POZ domain-containing protein [Rickenella mellea]|uniref:Elongin-C n=1 Tax=Rickenella mellea TaxID=50990 RepID=A0A4Y7PYY8_9AGAM|nr:POZ domain-containing protein [Rickenella mellea]